MPTYRSSKPHRDASRLNASAEIAASALKAIAPAAMIPAKITQAFNSGYCFFKPQVKTSERFMHATKCLLATAQIALLVTMLYKDDTCPTIKNALCKSTLLCELMYQGLLLVSWAPSELFKEPGETTPPVTPTPGTPTQLSAQPPL